MIGLALLALGLAALLVQGVLATLLPAPWCPDLGLLVVMGMGLCLGSASGLALASGLGLATDLLSGALLGQHALLRALAFGLTRAANLQLHLGRALPQMFFAVLVTVVHALALASLTALFGGAAGLDAVWLREVATQGVVNGACAPWIFRLTVVVGRRSAQEEARRHAIRLTRGPAT